MHVFILKSFTETIEDILAGKNIISTSVANSSAKSVSESHRLYEIPLIFFYYKVSDTKLSAFQLILLWLNGTC